MSSKAVVRCRCRRWPVRSAHQIFTQLCRTSKDFRRSTMKTLVLLILPLLVSSAGNDCNATLPWLVDRSNHPQLTDDQFSRLLQCPENLNGCSDTIPFCSWNQHLWTCSCADNCAVYGDCCWEKSSTPLASKPPSSCTRVNVENNVEKSLYIVTGCQKTWPQDEVRDGCENQKMYNDAFYETPVTSAKGVTYYNGFCAFCNYDMENVTFWNVSCNSYDEETCSGSERPVEVVLPGVVLDNYSTHLRPCGYADFIESCNNAINADVARRCQTYFAPVRSHLGATYKNVYCAICNGEDLSRVECSPPHVVFNVALEVESADDEFRFFGPNLVQLFRPVSSRDDCRVWQGNKCFIPKIEYRYNDSSAVTNASDTNDTSATSTEVVPAKQNVQIYFTVLCLNISLLCLALKALVYAIFKDSRGFSSKCTLCLSCTLFCSHLLFLLANSFPLPTLPCMISAMFLHFGFLSAFSWTTVLSFDIWKGVAAVKLSRGRRRAFSLYCLLAWGLPLCLVLMCAGIDYAVPSFLLAPRYGQATCWISSITAHAVVFLTPIAILLTLNAVFYVHIVVHIHRTKKQAAGFDFRGGGQESHIKLYVKLAFIMGATWIIGFACVYVESVITDVIFIMLVGLQGVYLFFGFKDYRWFVEALRGKRSLQQTTNTSENATASELSPVQGKGWHRTSE
ncbi:uncharacterized protein LOC135387496 [Ornithodoros turicata]|uniref:uncharacterized protein LOC135387496 n=1 Tax=Ornithodoros turicata TaxID=34597 RepID=UPI00313891E8